VAAASVAKLPFSKIKSLDVRVARGWLHQATMWLVYILRNHQTGSTPLQKGLIKLAVLPSGLKNVLTGSSHEATVH